MLTRDDRSFPEIDVHSFHHSVRTRHIADTQHARLGGGALAAVAPPPRAPLLDVSLLLLTFLVELNKFNFKTV